MDVPEALPGVGIKIIECLRVFSFAYPGVPLDTHNWKVMWRFGVLWPDFVGKPGELTAVQKRQAHLALRRIVPNGEGKALHNRLMRLGIENVIRCSLMLRTPNEPVHRAHFCRA